VVIESWHSTLEWELRSQQRFATKSEARAKVAAWIDEYNRDRKHTSIGMHSPIDYELAQRHRRDTEAAA
jgi:transposase InsO family protein